MTNLPKELSGNPFIASTVEVYGGPKKTMPMPRTCSYCFYRENIEGDNPKRDCCIANNKPKENFGIPLNEIMPRQIDGVEVGHYCKNWTDYNVE